MLRRFSDALRVFHSTCKYDLHDTSLILAHDGHQRVPTEDQLYELSLQGPEDLDADTLGALIQAVDAEFYRRVREGSLDSLEGSWKRSWRVIATKEVDVAYTTQVRGPGLSNVAFLETPNLCLQWSELTPTALAVTRPGSLFFYNLRSLVYPLPATARIEAWTGSGTFERLFDGAEQSGIRFLRTGGPEPGLIIILRKDTGIPLYAEHVNNAHAETHKTYIGYAALPGTQMLFPHTILRVILGAHETTVRLFELQNIELGVATDDCKLPVPEVALVDVRTSERAKFGRDPENWPQFIRNLTRRR